MELRHCSTQKGCLKNRISSADESIRQDRNSKSEIRPVANFTGHADTRSQRDYSIDLAKSESSTAQSQRLASVG